MKCPWHYAVFDVRDGRVSDRTVWATNLYSYPVKVDDSTGDILVNPNGNQSVAYYETYFALPTLKYMITKLGSDSE